MTRIEDLEQRRVPLSTMTATDKAKRLFVS